MPIERPYFRDPKRLQYSLDTLEMRDRAPVQQRQRHTRWFVQRLDGTLLDCGLEAAGKALAEATLLTWEANGQ